MKMNEELHIFNFAPPSALRTLKTMWAEDQDKRKENEKCVWIDRAQGALRTLKTMWAEEQGKRRGNRPEGKFLQRMQRTKHRQTKTMKKRTNDRVTNTCSSVTPLGSLGVEGTPSLSLYRVLQLGPQQCTGSPTAKIPTFLFLTGWVPEPRN